MDMFCRAYHVETICLMTKNS